MSGDRPSTQQCPEQFAGTTVQNGGPVQFWDDSGQTAGNEALGSGPFNFTYTERLGSDSACPNVSGRWIDASHNGDVSDPAGGNILAPGTGNC